VARRAGKAQPLTAKRSNESDKRGGLGGGYVLGKRLPYRSRAVRVTLAPQDAQQARDLLPGAWLHRDVMSLLKIYIGTTADGHRRMQMSSRFAPEPAVGKQRTEVAPRLGWTVVLPAQQERVITVELGVCEAFPSPQHNPYLQHRAA
jgi:type VI secretion system protein ImpH